MPAPTVIRDINSLVPYAKNARLHSEDQVESIAASMREFGWTMPILVAGDEIVAGHGRVLAASLLGLAEVPTIDASYLNAAQIRAYRLADNELTITSSWNTDILQLEMAGLFEAGFELTLTGFARSEIDAMLFPGDATNLAGGPGQQGGANNGAQNDDFVDFSFGDHRGRVHKALYARFTAAVETAKSRGAAFTLDDIIASWLPEAS